MTYTKHGVTRLARRPEHVCVRGSDWYARRNDPWELVKGVAGETVARVTAYDGDVIGGQTIGDYVLFCPRTVLKGQFVWARLHSFADNGDVVIVNPGCEPVRYAREIIAGCGCDFIHYLKVRGVNGAAFADERARLLQAVQDGTWLQSHPKGIL